MPRPAGAGQEAALAPAVAPANELQSPFVPDGQDALDVSEEEVQLGLAAAFVQTRLKGCCSIICRETSGRTASTASSVDNLSRGGRRTR
jgi:hypothetical protein